MNTHELSNSGYLFSAILLYAGPDQILPLMSVLGGILGVLLIFWQRFVRLVKGAGQFFMTRLRPATKKKG